jgi:sulfate adenylyltransferase
MTPTADVFSTFLADAILPGNRTCDLITPYGGTLVNLLMGPEEQSEQIRRLSELASVQITPKSVCDLELIATGVLSPLDRFMGREDVLGVSRNMRLAHGTFFPVPITLPVADPASVQVGKETVLRSDTNQPVAILLVEEIFESSPGNYCIAGPFRVLNLPSHHDFPKLRMNPATVRGHLRQRGNADVVAFPTRSPLHRSHEEFAKQAAGLAGASLLVHVLTDEGASAETNPYTLVQCCSAVVEKHFDPRDSLLCATPLAKRKDEIEETLLRIIVARNFGANHIVASRNSGSDVVAGHAEEIGVRLIPYQDTEYSREQILSLGVPGYTNGVSVYAMVDGLLAEGRDLPDWLTRPEVARILSEAKPPRHRQGFCIWLTGLPSAGKSTIANILTAMLNERGRQVTLLDGDVVRTHLSKGLGFSREDRDTNILRIGYVAAEIIRHNGIAICAAVSPYRATRDRVREMVGTDHFVEVFVDAPVEVCEERDVKGYYAKARIGGLQGFTGVDDPYEVPLAPEIVIATTESSPALSAGLVMRGLEKQGYMFAGRITSLAETELKS